MPLRPLPGDARPMCPVTTSVFELLKVGPGPSSSHTIGPMTAAADFMEQAARLPADRLALARGLKVTLQGSLAATGRGHGTLRAVLAGLLGNRPETCPPDILDAMAAFAAGELKLGAITLPVSEDCVVFDLLTLPKHHPNTLVFRLLDADGNALLEREAWSVGGGFVEWEGDTPPERQAPPHPYETMADLRALAASTGLSLPEILLANEAALTGRTPQEIASGLERIMRAMEDAVERGLEASGVLPGPLGLHRKAKALFERYRQDPQQQDRPILALCACAFAAAEENASGHTIVTAPTAGASGVLPAVLYVTKNLRPTAGVFRKDQREALLAAALVGMLAKHNASVSGAEVGCQGEVGVASAMAAAYLAQVHGHSPAVVENAAETALEHHLGLTCDPVQGYVQIPCIERNAMGAVKAYAAYQIAAAETPGHHMVGLDQAMRAMAETGRDMCAKYKETAQGGLAASVRC
ncbi:L-serine dehydratase TdcG [Fundidesulfovibrio magnetotacticus]|uniref:L-serine dehydratase n=1 Tax=Fundidesulfovibrio magnetotacticus TaxID=2730080 RepID=A0A6V8LUZ8_9BACT|nr:L-serine ammonia-lyase [Fundidesulfovibrio magnetotacticus]GFK93646.1 L-serine dehydratase TdcG [Fundidesulfovibrio magnetotacticus]